MFERYMAAFSLLNANHHREAWRMIQEGAEMVRPILLQQPPEFIGELLVHFSSRGSAGHDGIKMQLLRLISGMAIVVHGDRHPISILCQLLQTLHRNQDVIELGISKLRDVLKRQLGQTHSALIGVQQKFYWALFNQRRYDEAERALFDLIGICERIYDWNNYQARYTLYLLAHLYYWMRRDFEAEDVLVDVLQRGKEWGDCNFINIMANGIQGHIYFGRGDYEAAETSYWSALSGALHYFGPRDPETVRSRIHYQKVAALLQKHHDTCTEILEEPVRCLSRSRSSSQPPIAHRNWKADFCYEAPV
jgi:tetratricopeptide (TPR) repeat protein